MGLKRWLQGHTSWSQSPRSDQLDQPIEVVGLGNDGEQAEVGIPFCATRGDWLMANSFNAIAFYLDIAGTSRSIMIAPDSPGLD